MARLELRVLGGFRAQTTAGSRLRLPTKKAEALVAYVALPAGQVHPRDKLAALLWGDTPDEQARGSLRRTLAEVRKALTTAGVSGLVIEGRTVTLDPRAVDIDAVQLEQLVAEGTPEALHRAAALYQGDLLAGLAVDQPLFEEWLVGERERLRELGLEALARLLAHQNQGEMLEASIQTATRLVALDPLQEAAHRALMRLYARQGRRGSALRQYQVCTQTLQRELGVEPEIETRTLYREILRQRTSSSAKLPRSPANAFTDMERRVGPLVGRDAERAQLGSAVDRLLDGSGGVTVLLGEPGIGKTRLLSWLAEEATRREVRVVLGRAYQTEQVLAFGPWAAGLRSAPVADVIDQLEPIWRAELVRLLPELDPHVAPTFTADYSRLFEAVARLLAGMTATAPLVFLLEDVHWADEMSVRLIGFLSRRLAGTPLLLVVTTRVDESADVPVLRDLLQELAADARSRLHHLGPLSRDDTAKLVRALRRGARPDTMERIVEGVWRVSQGSPFVIVEAVQASSSMDAHPGMTLPTRVRELVLARLARLTRSARDVVAVAATVGRTFDLRILERAAGLDESEIAAGVEELVRRRLVRAVGEGFDFTHDHIRQLAYDQARGQHRLWHGRVAEALEALGVVDAPEAPIEQLAYHYAHAGNAPKAVEYLTRFAEASARVFAHDDAIAALDRARAHADRLPAADRDRVRVDLLLRRAFSMSVLGRVREVLALLAPESVVVERLGDAALSAAYHFRLGLAHSILGKQSAAVASASRAVADARRCGDEATLGKASYVLGLAAFWSGLPMRGVEPGEQSIALLRRTRERHFLGLAYWALTLNRLLLGQFAVALASAAETERIGQELGDPRLLSLAASSAGWVHATMGDTARGIEMCQLGLDRARDSMSQCAAAGYLGYAYLEHDDAGAALALLDRSATGLAKLALPHVAGRVDAWLALAHLASGHVDEAREAGRRSLEEGMASDCRDVIAQAHRALGRIAAATNDPLRAHGHLTEALQRFSEIGAEYEVARTRLALGEFALRVGDRAVAAAEFVQARQLFLALGATHLAERTDALRG